MLDILQHINLTTLENEVNQANPTIDWTKPVQTRDGQPFELLTTKLRSGTHTVLGYIGSDTHVTSFTAQGYYTISGCEHPHDLVQPPEQVTVYLNVYGTVYFNVYGTDGSALAHPTRAEADRNASGGRIACIKVQYTPGQFDD